MVLWVYLAVTQWIYKKQTDTAVFKMIYDVQFKIFFIEKLYTTAKNKGI